MSTPVNERQRGGGSAASRTAQARIAAIPVQRGTRTAVPAQRTGARPPIAQRAYAQRAYARRDDRARRLVGARAARSAGSGRAQFVLLVMVLLAVGLVATLWLSTAAAADSYRLQDARLEARALAEQSARLHREVAGLAAAPALAERAGELGMVVAQDPARLVLGPDGDVVLVGEPRPAVAPLPPAEPGEPGAAGPEVADPDSSGDDAAPPPEVDTAPESGAPVAVSGSDSAAVAASDQG